MATTRPEKTVTCDCCGGAIDLMRPWAVLQVPMPALLRADLLREYQQQLEETARTAPAIIGAIMTRSAEAIVPHHFPLDICSICVLTIMPTIEDKLTWLVRRKIAYEFGNRSRRSTFAMGSDE